MSSSFERDVIYFKAMKDQTRIDNLGVRDCTGNRRSTRGKISWRIALILILICAAYWLKCQLGFNFFDTISISSYFPFNYLEDDVISAREPGIVINQNFEDHRIFHRWASSNFRHNSGAHSQIVDGGFGNDSHYLKITCDGKYRWAYPISKFIAVAQGDTFHLQGRIYLENHSVPARLCIAAFDENKKIINWDLAVQGTKGTGSWIEVQKQFAITDLGTRYITFRVTGAKGVYGFDNLLLSKLSRPRAACDRIEQFGPGLKPGMKSHLQILGLAQR